jgi:hypothetical protein
MAEKVKGFGVAYCVSAKYLTNEEVGKLARTLYIISL